MDNQLKRALVITDKESTLSALKIAFSRLPDFEMHIAPNYEQARALFADTSWNLIVLDVMLPVGNGFALLTFIQSRKMPPTTLACGGKPETAYGMRSYRGGAAGYIHELASADEFVVAIQTILEGDRYVSPFLSNCVAQASLPEYTPPLDSQLTSREFYVLKKITQGETIKQIATEVKISEKTVSNARLEIMRKLEVTNLAGVLRYCLDHGFMDP